MATHYRSKRRVFHSDAPALLAEAWLLAWGRIGGSLTIAADGSLRPGFDAEVGCADDDCATVLVAELIDTPSLHDAVRSILVAGAPQKPQHPNFKKDIKNVAR